METRFRLARLGTVATLRSGFPFRSQDWKKSGVPVVKIANVKDGRLEMAGCSCVSPDVASEASEFSLRPGDVVLGMTGYVGEVALVTSHDVPALLNQRVGRFSVTDPHRLDPRFLFYVLRLPDIRRQIEQLGYGTAQPNVSPSDVHRLEIPLPGLMEQVAITRLLGALDDKIELNRRMNHTLEAMGQTLFRSWFVDLDPVRAKAEGRAVKCADTELAALFSSSFVAAGCPPTPTGWRWTELGSCLSTVETGTRPKGGVRDIRAGVPSVGAESITRVGDFDFAKTKYVPREFYDSMGRGHVASGDVLLYKDGGRPGEFEPKVSLVGRGFPFAEFCINEHVYRLRAASLLSQTFLYFFLSAEPTKEEMRRRGTGVAVPGLNSTAVRALPVLIPSAEVIRMFDNLAQPLVDAILCNSNESVTLAAVRDLLLPGLLSGEVQVRDAEASVAATV